MKNISRITVVMIGCRFLNAGTFTVAEPYRTALSCQSFGKISATTHQLKVLREFHRPGTFALQYQEYISGDGQGVITPRITLVRQ
ncbi:MAG: hypothetical protein ACP5I8_03360 [Phycisphaerae bacterium]